MNVNDVRFSAAIPATTIEVRLDDHEVERLAALLAELVNKTQATSEQWLNVAGAAAHLGSTENSIRNLVKRRRIPFHRTEGRLRFAVTELDHWVRTGSCAPTHEDLP